jgi:hypothetical protein
MQEVQLDLAGAVPRVDPVNGPSMQLKMLTNDDYAHCRDYWIVGVDSNDER